jgi:hypothetical protein
MQDNKRDAGSKGTKAGQIIRIEQEQLTKHLDNAPCVRIVVTSTTPEAGVRGWRPPGGAILGGRDFRYDFGGPGSKPCNTVKCSNAKWSRE